MHNLAMASLLDGFDDFKELSETRKINYFQLKVKLNEHSNRWLLSSIFKQVVEPRRKIAYGELPLSLK